MAVYLSAAAIAAISLLVGGVICRLVRIPAGTAPALGLSACIVTALICMRLPGEAFTAAAALALAAAVSALVLVRNGLDVRQAGVGVPLGLLLLLVCSLPFIAYGRIGELGPGFSADLALHMGQADALRAVGPSASVTVPGYPIGPHTLVAAVGEGLGLDTRSVFLGLLLAVPRAHGPDRPRRVRRSVPGPAFARRGAWWACHTSRPRTSSRPASRSWCSRAVSSASC